MCGHARDPIIYSEFHRNPFRGFGAPGGQNLAFPITLASRFYNSLYYRTSRDRLLFYCNNLLVDVKLAITLYADDISSRVPEFDKSASGTWLWRICARLSSWRFPVLLWTVGLYTWFVYLIHYYNIPQILLGIKVSVVSSVKTFISSINTFSVSHILWLLTRNLLQTFQQSWNVTLVTFWDHWLTWINLESEN